MAALTPRAEVTVYSPLTSPFRQPLEGEGISIGRASDCTIPIKDRFLSRRHAEIRPAAGGWTVADLGSTNGVRLNGRSVRGAQALQPGDRVELGSTEIVFELG